MNDPRSAPVNPVIATGEVPSLQIRDITEISEMLVVEQLQKEVWGIADREIFPALALVPMIEVGGVLVGAFDQQQLVGFVFGFPGQENGKAILHSDMLAVRHEHRRHGLGYWLKLAQRKRALTRGIETITWTFDPLQARNARLNLGKLGVIADSYRINYYGETTSFLHQFGTDRLWVTWQLNSERVRRRIEGKELSIPVDEAETILQVSEAGEPLDVESEAAAGGVAIEIPADINLIAGRDSTFAIRWRAATRAAFNNLLNSGYRVSEFQFVAGRWGQVGRYLLTSSAAFNE